MTYGSDNETLVVRATAVGHTVLKVGKVCHDCEGYILLEV